MSNLLWYNYLKIICFSIHIIDISHNRFIALCNYPQIKSYCLPKIICVQFRLILYTCIACAQSATNWQCEINML